MTERGAPLWAPSAEVVARSHVKGYLTWLSARRGLDFASYDELWRWSVDDLEGFWTSIWEHFDVRASKPAERALASRDMPGARWFPGAELNYAENALARRGPETAVVARGEDGSQASLSRDELVAEVTRVAAGMARLGVTRGDRVVAVLPNGLEALVAFLAAASLGATWSSCSPEFGVPSILDRFRQVEPKLLLAVSAYSYNGKVHDRRAAVEEIRGGLPTLAATVLVSRGGLEGPAGLVRYEDLGGARTLTFEQVPFDHPLWILYSSGTTGLPKAIVQGHGGILLEHLKALSLHCDLGEGDRFFWFTTTGWMMWNFLVSGLLVGATVVLWDGSPAHPDLGALWRFAEEAELTYFGTSAPYLMACRKAGIVPHDLANLSRLRAVGSTGAPLPPEGFAWVYENVSPDVLLGSISGGSDACTAFVLSCPLLPVHAGEIQCRGLGAAVHAFDEGGRPVVDEVGELVITQPLPSMPLFLWNDADGRRYRESYFGTYPGVWRHGDWITITSHGSCIVHGRSDSTLNRAGVRMGTAEFYSIVEAIPEVADSLVVDTGSVGDEGKLWLFLALRAGATLDAALEQRLKAALRAQVSPRHVPDEIRAVAEIPRTLNGKKIEVPIKRLLEGTPLATAVNPETLANPAALEPFLALAGAARRPLD